jgi:hypothetical protein
LQFAKQAAVLPAAVRVKRFGQTRRATLLDEPSIHNDPPIMIPPDLETAIFTPGSRTSAASKLQQASICIRQRLWQLEGPLSVTVPSRRFRRIFLAHDPAE